MTLNVPKPKKKCKLQPSQPLPIIYTKDNQIRRFSGGFNGFCVEIDNEDDKKTLISMGYFGKATLSRSYPQFQTRKPEILRKRVFENRKRHGHQRNSSQKVIVVPDSDSETEEYFTNLRPEYQVDRSGIKEAVNLGLEEAFFLATALSCLDVSHNGRILNCEELWGLFKENDKYYVQNYAVYYYFRARKWIVKPGIKFGGDFLLYKEGPPFYHASYVVIIHVVDENLKKIEELNRRSMKNTCLMGLNRLCETAGKELLICDLIWPSTLKTVVSFTEIPKFSIKETIMKRWISSQERQADEN